METDRIICIKKRKAYEEQCKNINEYKIIDCTSQNKNEVISHGLSPLWLGPAVTAENGTSLRFENLWQFTKVYSEFTDANGNPTQEYFNWKNAAFANNAKGIRFPFGKPRKPLYALWYINGVPYKLGYLEARKLIYIPEYAKLVTQSPVYWQLKEFYERGNKIALTDFDAYNNHSEEFNMNMVDVYNCYKKAGHAFVLKMLLEGDIEVINGQVIDNIGVLKI